jgi:uncharacterized protein YndB with AHSA1/START domain
LRGIVEVDDKERILMTMRTSDLQAVESFEIRREVDVHAPIELVFESTLEQLGPDSLMPGGKPFPMTFEARPGGRWYRDLGNDAGHLWGHVQVIKPPTLIEICGPLMMSYPAINHLQYRLTAEGDRTRMLFLHRAVGLVQPEHRDGLLNGWNYWLERICELAERKAAEVKNP